MSPSPIARELVGADRGADRGAIVLRTCRPLAPKCACGSDSRTVTLSQSDFECAWVAVSRLSADCNDVLRCCAFMTLASALPA